MGERESELNKISQGGHFMLKISEEDLERERREGREEGREEGEANMVKRLFTLGNTVKQIAELFQIPEAKVEEYLAMKA